MTSSADLSIGLVDLPTLATPLAAAGLRVIGGGVFREAAAEIKTAAEQGPIAAIFVADHPQPGIKAWLTRMSAHGAVVVIVRADLPRLEIDGARSVDLPATVAELLDAAGLTATSTDAAATRIGVDGETSAPVPASTPSASSASALAPAPTLGLTTAADDTPADHEVDPAPATIPQVIAPADGAETALFDSIPGITPVVSTPVSSPAVDLTPADTGSIPVPAPEALAAAPVPACFRPFRADPIKFATARRAAKATEAADDDLDTPAAVPVVQAARVHLVPALPASAVRSASPWDDESPAAQHTATPAAEPQAPASQPVVSYPASPWDSAPSDTPAAEAPSVAPFVLPPARDEEWFGAASSPALTDTARPAAATPLLAQPVRHQPPADPILTAPAYQPAPEPTYTEPAYVRTVAPAPNPQDAVDAMFAAAAPPAESAPRVAPRRIRGHGSPLAIVCAEKGGVGKTNTTLALAQRAADLAPGRRVVLIDMNRGQGDIRKYLKLGGAQLPSILDAAISGNVADAVLSPEQVTAARHASLPPISFGVVLAPEPESADPRIVTPDVYQRVIDMVRDQADLVVVDTQIVEIHDTSGLVDGLIVPTLAHDAYGVTLTDTSAPGVSNLVTMLHHFAQQGVPANRLMIVINRALQGYDTNVLRGMLTKYGTFAGAVEEKSLLARQANMGRIPHNDPVLAPVLDAVLLRVTGWPCFQPVAVVPTRKKLFSFGRKSA